MTNEEIKNQGSQAGILIAEQLENSPMRDFVKMQGSQASVMLPCILDKITGDSNSSSSDNDSILVNFANSNTAKLTRIATKSSTGFPNGSAMTGVIIFIDDPSVNESFTIRLDTDYPKDSETRNAIRPRGGGSGIEETAFLDYDSEYNYKIVGIIGAEGGVESWLINLASQYPIDSIDPEYDSRTAIIVINGSNDNVDGNIEDVYTINESFAERIAIMYKPNGFMPNVL